MCLCAGGGGEDKNSRAYLCYLQGFLNFLELGEKRGGRIKIAWYIYTVKTYVTRHDLHFSVPLSRLLH